LPRIAGTGFQITETVKPPDIRGAFPLVLEIENRKKLEISGKNGFFDGTTIMRSDFD